MNDFPTVIQNGGNGEESAASVEHNAMKPILPTRNVEEIPMVAQLVNLLRGRKRGARTAVPKTVEVRKRECRRCKAHGGEDDYDQSAGSHDLTRMEWTGKPRHRLQARRVSEWHE